MHAKIGLVPVFLNACALNADRRSVGTHEVNLNE